jgi:hypothetical protein
MKKKAFTKDDLIYWRCSHGLTQSEASDICCLKLRAYQNLEYGESEIRSYIPKLVDVYNSKRSKKNERHRVQAKKKTTRSI